MTHQEKKAEPTAETTAETIDKFIQQLTPLLGNEENQVEEEEVWADALPPGHDLGDYRPDPNVAIPLPPPPPHHDDLGRIPNHLLEHTPPSPGDREDSSAQWGLCGLLNTGNTCYMNAGLQCIRNIPDIASFYLGPTVPVPHPPPALSDGEKPEKHEACKGHLSARFSTLMQKLWSGRFSAVHPKAFKTTLGLLHTQFAGSRQQDCQEFLAMLLDTLHEDSASHCRETRGCEAEGGVRGGGSGSETVNGEGEEDSTNQIAEDEESCDPVEDESERRKEAGGVGVSLPHGSGSSVITDTFQGMLRNEVVCNSCKHLSTKTEPFVYLSLPLPHAYERQIEINWVPVCSEYGSRKIIKALVTVLKHVTVGEVKDSLLAVVGRGELSRELVLLAEVKDRSVSRVVSDSLLAKHVADDKNDIYAFEMAPIGSTATVEVSHSSLTSQRPEPGKENEPTPQQLGYMPLPSGEEASSSSTAPAISSDPWMPTSGLAAFSPPPGDNLDMFGSERFSGGVDGVKAHGGEHSTDGVKAHGGKHGKANSDSEGEALPTKMIKSEDESRSSSFEIFGTPPESMDCDAPPTVTPGGEAPPITRAEVVPQAVVVEWHSCSICLEEMVDSDLLTHRDCGAIICPTCLQASTEHYGKDGGLLACPICSVTVKPSEAFSPLATNDDSRPVIRLLQTNILFRVVERGGTLRLHGHPSILNLPSSDNGSTFYSAIAPLLSPLTAILDWDLCLTDTKGQYCSRCQFGSSCRGCVIANSELTFDLKPGDHISVTFSQRPEEGDAVERHPSLDLKHNNQLSLEECLEAFSQREFLGPDNHWYCPSCQAHKEAIRTLSVSSLPSTLIIHLKRFVYHGQSGSKVNASVTFPMELKPGVVSVETTCEDPLELTACVCHFGTMHCGHYTAYCRHPKSREWYYYNDETVTKSKPDPKVTESAYILFYQQKAPSPPTIPLAEGSFDDAAEMKSVEQLLRLFKKTLPPTSRPLPPLPHLKRTNSDTNLSDPTGEKSTAQANSFLASLGLDTSSLTRTPLPSSLPPRARSSSNPQLAQPIPTLPALQKDVLETHPSLEYSAVQSSFDPQAVKLLSVKMTDPW